MRYIILNKTTQNIVQQSGKDLIFRSKKRAIKFLQNSLLNKEGNAQNYKLEKLNGLKDPVATSLTEIENSIKDIYHAIEIVYDDKTLLILAHLLKDQLTKRRKLKDKKKGLHGSSVAITPYKNRTSILEELFEKT